jgi:hypothetical protein
MDEKPPTVILDERIRERYRIMSKDRTFLSSVAAHQEMLPVAIERPQGGRRFRSPLRFVRRCLFLIKIKALVPDPRKGDQEGQKWR